MMFHCSWAAGPVPVCWSRFSVRRPRPYHLALWSGLRLHFVVDCGTLQGRNLTVCSAALQAFFLMNCHGGRCPGLVCAWSGAVTAAEALKLQDSPSGGTALLNYVAWTERPPI